MVQFEEIKFDCRLYNGYKPCRYGNECAGCPWFDPHDPEHSGWIPQLEIAPLEGLPEYAEILIIKTGALGDVLRTTTLLQPLKRKYPKARITWVTAQGASPLLSANHCIDVLIAMEDVPAIDNLCQLRFDAIICLEKEGPQLALAAAITADRRAGYSPTPWNAAAISNLEARYMLVLGVSDDLKFFRNTKSYPEIIAEAVGLPFERDPYILNLTPAADQAHARIRAILKERGTADRPVVGLNTGCGAVFRTKQWTLDGWAGTAQALLEAGYPNVMLMGGPAEEELNAAIIARVPELIDAGTQNPLEDFFGIVQACDVVVTSDSLGMHIAIAREKYVVALFGSTSHHEIDLFEQGEKVITDFPCSPCYLKTCDKKPTCMEAMNPGQVVDAVLRGLTVLNNSTEQRH